MAYTHKISSTNYQNKTRIKEICPILLSYNFIEGRWKTHVMWAIRTTPLRFGEIRKAIPLATERMVARRVAELLEHGLIEALEKDGIKTYRLTEEGKMLLPVLRIMGKTGELLKRKLA